MLIVIILPFIFAELYLSLSVVEEIGAGYSVIWIIGSIFLGITLLKNSQYTIANGMENVVNGKLGLDNFKNASMAYVFGSIFILIPGIITDVFGIGLLLYTIYLHFIAKVTPEKQNLSNQQKGDDNVIDVEIIE
ncbi:hypothetical protein MNB_SV-9-942 [hydrothermal vent metagenome]|uniref:FxsA protein n=1 Tax=hydrothermal vent metagenome TaxID=652676 RepID=A0A1W1C4G4_9ZZZZ